MSAPARIAVDSVRMAVERWDSRDIRAASVVRVGDALWMLYSAADSRHEYALGLALSERGESWTRLDDAPVLAPAGTRRRGGVHSYLAPTLAYDGTRLVAACTPQTNEAFLQPRIWVSDNGVDWTEIGATIPVQGRSPSVVHWRGRYHMLLCCGRVPTGSWLMGETLVHLVSDDLATWRIVGLLPTDAPGHVGHPSLSVGPDGLLTAWLTVTGADGAYEIWSTALSEDGEWDAPAVALTRDEHADETAGVQAASAVWTDAGWSVWYVASPTRSDGFRGAVYRARGAERSRLVQDPRRPVLRVTPGLYMNPS